MRYEVHQVLNDCKYAVFHQEVSCCGTLMIAMNGNNRNITEMLTAGRSMNLGDILDKPVRRVCTGVKVEAVLEGRTFAVVLENIRSGYCGSTAKGCKEKVSKMHVDESDGTK